MAKYRRKSTVVNAYQWFKVSKNDNIEAFRYCSYYECLECDKPISQHGWIISNIVTGEGQIVCPGDWIITGTSGEEYLCKNNIFDDLYEKI